MHTNWYIRHLCSHHTEQPCFWSHRMHHIWMLFLHHRYQFDKRKQIFQRTHSAFHCHTDSSHPLTLTQFLQIRIWTGESHHIVTFLLKFLQQSIAEDIQRHANGSSTYYFLTHRPSVQLVLYPQTMNDDDNNRGLFSPYQDR